MGIYGQVRVQHHLSINILYYIPCYAINAYNEKNDEKVGLGRARVCVNPQPSLSPHLSLSFSLSLCDTGYRVLKLVIDGRTLRAIKARCSIYVDCGAPAFRIGEF